MLTVTQLDVVDLELDLINPRITGKKDQQQALAAVLAVEDQGNKVYGLARKIKELRGLDPGDAFYVMKSERNPVKFVVLDGNRRLSALRMVSDPPQIDLESLRISAELAQRFRKLAQGSGEWAPQSVNAVIFETREQARPYIELRHGGEMEGAGRHPWNAIQNRRERNDGLWQLLNYLLNRKLLSPEAETQIDTATYAITNLERFVRNEAASRLFGFKLSSSDFSIGPTPELAAPLLRKLANRIASTYEGPMLTSRSHETAASMAAFLADLLPKESKSEETPSTPPAGEAVPSTRKPPIGERKEGDLDESSTLPQQADSTSARAGAGGPEQKRCPVPRLASQRYLIRKDEVPRTSSGKCSELIGELRSGIAYREAPNAAGLLLRSLLELTSYDYLIEHGEKPNSNKTERIKEAAIHLRNHDGPEPDRARRQEHADALKNCDAYGLLSSGGHSPTHRQSAEGVMAIWQTVMPALSVMWQRIERKKAAAGKTLLGAA